MHTYNDLCGATIFFTHFITSVTYTTITVINLPTVEATRVKQNGTESPKRLSPMFNPNALFSSKDQNYKDQDHSATLPLSCERLPVDETKNKSKNNKNKRNATQGKNM